MDARAFPFTKTIRDLPATTPFVSPEALVRQRGGRPFWARLGANESGFGPSPRALAAMQAEAAESWRYGDPDSFELRATLAELWGCGEDRLLVGAGIDGLLGLAVRITVDPGTPVVTSQGAYPTFNYHIAAFGGVRQEVPYRDDREDLDALARAAWTHRPPMVYLANPDNPMGTWHDGAAVAAFAEALPEDTLLVLDEAYAELAPAGTALPLDRQGPRVLRFRTFSKLYGLAGQRIGYLLAHPQVITAMNKIRNHFEVTRVSQAGALAALNDTDYAETTAQAITAGRDDYARIAAENGLSVLPSATNFVAIDVGGSARAKALLQALRDRDVFVRMPGVPPLDRCIRVTVGPPEARAIFEAALPEALKDLA